MIRYFYLFVFGLSFWFVACDDSEQNQKDFQPYISAYTGGLISNQATIKVRLLERSSQAKAEELVTNEILSFEPHIEGETYWLDEQTVEFRPAESLPAETAFQAKLKLDKLLEVPDGLETFKFDFETLKQSVKVTFKGLSQDRSDSKYQVISGVLKTNDYADNETVEKSFQAAQNDKNLRIIWEHEADGKTHNFQVQKVTRTEKSSQVKLAWKGAELGFEGEGKKTIHVPALSEFKILEIATGQQEEQVIDIYFSDPIDESQDLNGLIYLNPPRQIKVLKNGNNLKIYPTKYLKGEFNLVVEAGVQNIYGYQFQSKYSQRLSFNNLKPEVKFLSKGTILPSTNGLILPFSAVSLKAVNVKIIRIFENNIAQFLQRNQLDGGYELRRVGRIIFKGEVPLKTQAANVDYSVPNTFSIDLTKFIKVEPGAIYRVHFSFDRSQAIYPCGNKDEIISPQIDNENEEESYDNPNFNYYDYRNYKYSERDNPCTDSYYAYRYNYHSPVKNILASDFGIIAKVSQGNRLHVAVVNLRTTELIPGVNLEIYNFQNQLIGKQVSNGEGFGEIDLDTKPYLLVAKQGNQRGYLRLDDGNALSMSMFDVGGKQIQAGLNGYIYGERGVWRPGDSIYTTFVLQDLQEVLPENHPVLFELYTPTSQLYERQVKIRGLNGFYDFRTATTPNAPTGNWTAKIKVGSEVFTKKIKIETVKPNRLKIDLDFGKPILRRGRQQTKLAVKWLHGAPAKNIQTQVELTLSKTKTNFKGYKAYHFDDVSKDFSTQRQELFKAKVNNLGQANFQTNLQVKDEAPGLLQAFFTTRAFEQGGDFSVDRKVLKYSPYSSYVGLKIPKGKGYNDALYSDETNVIPIVTVAENGKPITRRGLKIEVYKVYWRWWWAQEDKDELARYVANKTKNLLFTTTINTLKGKANFELKFPQEHYGRVFIRITDPVSGHSTGQTFYVTYKGWWESAKGDNTSGAELLTFETDKTKYEVGELIKVKIPTAKQGITLASLEVGNRILDEFWVNMEAGENTFEIEATEAMTPNVYLHLTLIQPHGNVKNDLPIRLYGVQSVQVENVKTHLQPVLKMADVLEPEQNFTVSVSEENENSMTYTLAVVDEGLLDLTRFKTPDLWQHFYTKQALSVRTWDLYPYVIGAFTGKMVGLLAIGGDESSANLKPAKVNRFKPIVKFLGPFELEGGQTNTHMIQMPNYIGSVRTMVVAGSNGAYGSVQKSTPVKKPLMVLGTLPRVLAPNETVTLPVTVFALEDNIKQVSVQVSTNDLLALEGTKEQTINFQTIGEEVVNFKLKVKDKLGVGRVTIEAKSGAAKAVYTIDLNIRTSNPPLTQVESAVLQPNERWTNNYNAFGITGTNKGSVEISTLPALKLEQRLDYLIAYPHGCIEQTVSAVFPQLFLSNLLDLPADQRAEIETNIKAALKRLKTFQISSGGLAYWQGLKTANDWGTSYAGHFILEAQALGFQAPLDFLKQWKKFQKKRANNWQADDDKYGSYASNALQQAYRLYTLALAKAPALGAMNRLKALKNLPLTAKWRLAAAYYLIGKQKVAKNLIADATTTVTSYRELAHTFGSAKRDKAMILETLCLLEEKDQARSILQELAQALASKNWYSTQTTAYSLLAIAKFVRSFGGTGQQVQYSYTLNQSKKQTISQTKPLSSLNLQLEKQRNGTVSITNTGSKTIFIKLQMTGVPLENQVQSVDNNLFMNLTYRDLADNIINPTALPQGTDFVAEVSIRHPGLRGTYRELALTQIFPSGWEIRNNRLNKLALKQASFSYQDLRDDRVLTYFDLQPNQQKTFRIMLNAAYRGSYALPAVTCAAMYDNEINAVKKGGLVTVK